jgi:hypothetical protein
MMELDFRTGQVLDAIKEAGGQKIGQSDQKRDLTTCKSIFLTGSTGQDIEILRKNILIAPSMLCRF